MTGKPFIPRVISRDSFDRYLADYEAHLAATGRVDMSIAVSMVRAALDDEEFAL